MCVATIISEHATLEHAAIVHTAVECTTRAVSSVNRAVSTAATERTVSASISGSFDIGHGAFAPPARPLLMPAAAHERLRAVPGRWPCTRAAKGAVNLREHHAHRRCAALKG